MNPDDKTVTDDGAVTPMEAQNQGPSHKGPSKEPEPQPKASRDARKDEAPQERMRKGGEASTRDDL
ncbi:MAG: hypothetical protein H7Y08_04225 [Rhizobiaceae bacterium]|nr:hypothetical protein [Rhizobiaceae bacterium]